MLRDNYTRISKVQDLFDPTKKYEFVIFINDSQRYDDGYGGTAEAKYLSCIAFDNENALNEYLGKETSNTGYSRGTPPENITVVPFSAFFKIAIETKIIVNKTPAKLQP